MLRQLEPLLEFQPGLPKPNGLGNSSADRHRRSPGGCGYRRCQPEVVPVDLGNLAFVWFRQRLSADAVLGARSR